MSDSHSTLQDVAFHGGVLLPRDLERLAAARGLWVNGEFARAETSVRVGDRVGLGPAPYRVIQGGRQRLQLVGDGSSTERIRGRVRVHAGYHKCMTMYQARVYGATCRAYNRTAGRLGRPHLHFYHFFHRLDAFYANCTRHAISSVSGHAIDLDRFDDIRVVRFIRDPRDLLVSGYFYHKRAPEHWCELAGSIDVDWMMVNGAVPTSLPEALNFADYLNRVDQEEGLFAELEFRRLHYESMMAWPEHDERVRLYRYEDVLGNEADTFKDIFEFLEMPTVAVMASRYFASKFRAGRKAAVPGHIRNPTSGQWRDLFSPLLKEKFAELYGDMLDRYGYPRQ